MNIGDKIRVTFRVLEAFVFNSPAWRNMSLDGTVIRSVDGDPRDSFRLLTGVPDHPIYLVQNSQIKNIEYLGKSIKQLTADRPRFVIVEGKNSHRVSLFNSGYVACDCKGFSFRRRCSHRDLVLNWLKDQYGGAWKKRVFV